MPDVDELRLIISCGGTGGHFFPGLGIAEELRSRNGHAVLLLGGKHAFSQKQTAKNMHMPAEVFSFTPPGKNPVTFCKFLYSIWKGYCKTLSLIRRFDPDAVLIMGSSVSLPVLLGAKWKGIPVFLHDGNARVGKANRVLSRYAKAIALSYPAINENTLRCPSVLTGFPLRKTLTDSKLNKEEGICELNRQFSVSFDPAKPTLLVMGGSLGAKSINEKFSVDLKDPATQNLQIIHIAGPGKAYELEAKYRPYPAGSVLLLESTAKMDIIYASCDAVICRAGGSSVSELAFYGKYSLLIPYPYAAERHQDDNAAWLAAAGGAEILHQSKCSSHAYQEFVSRFLADFEGYKKKGESLRSLAKPEAAENVLKMIVGNLN